MERLIPRALALFLLVMLPAVQAQDVADPILVMEDPAGDTGDPTGRSAALDILALDVAEGAVAFQFRILVAALDPVVKAPLLDAVVYEEFFHFAGVAYQIRAIRDASLAGPIQATLLSDPSGGQNFELAADLQAGVDQADQAIVVRVPRTVLVDAAGVPAFAGQALTGFWAQSSGLVSSMDPVPQDRAPDQGEAATVVEVKYGVHQQGDAKLTSKQPFRSSNGEAAAFRYVLVAQNLGDDGDRYRFEASRVPPGWRVAVPEDAIEIAGKGQQEIEVVADVPFSHRHGRLETFTLTMSSLSDDSSVGRILLGILYTEPAQPAGHHDKLTLHSRVGPGVTATMATALGSAGGGVDAYMNTLVDDPADAGVEVPPQFDGPVSLGTVTAFTWMVPLRPGLALGLDFDLGAVGQARIPFTSPTPLVGATLTGSVRLLGNGTPEPGAGTALAQLVAEPPADVTGAAVLEATVNPLEAGDYVPFAPENDLWLELTLTYARPDVATGPATPKMVPGGTLQLPLLEYRDDAAVEGAADSSTVGDDKGDGNDGPAGSKKGAPGVGLAHLALAFVAVLVAAGRRRS